MIPAPSNVVARFKIDPAHPQPSYQHRPVIAFNDNGEALVVGDRLSGGLVPAAVLSGFDGLEELPPPIVSMAPAGGWRVEYTWDDGSTSSEPLVGWGLHADGAVSPLGLDMADMDFAEPLQRAGGRWRIYHPDSIAPDHPVMMSR